MKKFNMVDKYTAIKAMLNGEGVEGFGLEDAVKFIDERIVQVEKKNAGNGERKPTKTQLENEGIKTTIMAVLTSADKPITIGEMQKMSAEIAEYSNQKMSALLTQLGKAGVVTRTEVKGKAHFAIAK